MKIPLGDNTIGYVAESQFVSYINKVKCRGAYFRTNDIYEGKHGHTTMTFQQFKEKYPIPSNRYSWMRYVERKYN